jgi:hypothetical protein
MVRFYMSREYIREKWLQYFKTLREDLSAETLRETKDAFYAGAIGGLSVMNSTHGAAADDVEVEFREYITEVKARLETLEYGTQENHE